MRCIIARHVAQYVKPKFAEIYYLIISPMESLKEAPPSSTPSNSQLKKYITNNEQHGLPPTRAAVFFDLSNMFNAISPVEFLDIIATSFPELIPLIQLVYDSPGTAFYKLNIVQWTTLFMEEGSTQGCPFSQILASQVVVRLLEPINNSLVTSSRTPSQRNHP